MRKWKHAWLEQACTQENFTKAYKEACKGSRKNNKTLIYYSNQAHRDELMAKLLSGTWVPKKPIQLTKRDKYNGKLRHIHAPNFETKIVEHALAQTFVDDMQKYFIKYTLASIKGRGIEYGRYLLKHIAQIGGKDVKYYVKWDIKQFFPSVNLDIAIKIYSKHIQDPRMLHYIWSILNVNCDGKGLPLGSYLSQWTANLVLSPLDHWAKEVKKIKYYLGYMDDRIAFFSSKKKANAFIKDLEVFVSTLDFEIKHKGSGRIMLNKWAKHPVNMIGYRTQRNGKQKIRKGIYLSLTRMLRRVRKNGRVSKTQARSIISRFGLIKHSDSKYLCQKIEKMIRIYKIKELVV